MSLRIAMWSGPRNISTAMMRSWGNRPDTIVRDEPLYAHYLSATGLDHPGAREIIAHHERDPAAVIHDLLAPLPPGRTVLYQKHMAHHLLPDVPRDWLDEVESCFLIREPKEMLASLHELWPGARLEDTGLPQQWEIFERVSDRTGRAPAILDARDVLEDPRRMLGLLCDRLGVPFTDAMLAWPAGPRDTDGIWAKHWYAAVERSTGFLPYRRRDRPVPEDMKSVEGACRAYYERLWRERLV